MNLPNGDTVNELNDNKSMKWLNRLSLSSDYLGLTYRLVDCVLLFVVLTYQNSSISYYITLYNKESNEWYFLFLVDFIMTFLFMIGAFFATRYYRRLHVLKRNGGTHTSDNDSDGSRRIFNINFPLWMGALPLVWISWIFYVIVISIKIFVIHLQKIAVNLYLNSQTSVEMDGEPHTLRLCLGAMAIVFLLWIEIHRNNMSHHSKECIKELTTTVVFEIFDSIDLLELLIPESPKDKNWNSSLSQRLYVIIVVLAALNLLLPTIGLFRLSRSRFSSHKLGLRMNILHNILRIVLVNIPYMVLRIFFWVAIEREISIFLLKNALFLFVSIRHIVSEIHELRKSKQESKNETELPLKEVPEPQTSNKYDA